jgi:hypothetical protein
VIIDPELNAKNIIQKTYPLPELIFNLVEKEDWLAVDQYFLKEELPGGSLHRFLSAFLEFKSIEHIIAIRSAPDDEDGIWHDDGSRILGFSLSLTINSAQTSGGHLRFRPKSEAEFQSITTRPIGEILLFKTGIYGFEHMVSAVTEGKRIVLAGWCS